MINNLINIQKRCAEELDKQCVVKLVVGDHPTYGDDIPEGFVQFELFYGGVVHTILVDPDRNLPDEVIVWELAGYINNPDSKWASWWRDNKSD